MSKMLLFGYWFVTCIIAVVSYVFIDQNLSYLKSFYTGFHMFHRETTTIVYVVLISILFGLYFFLLHTYKQSTQSVRDIKLLLLAVCFTLFFAYPAMLSHDIFNYIATAKVSFFYHENPYIIMPIEFVGDPLVEFMHAANKVALYGPVWIGLTGIPFLLGVGNFIITLFLFKLVATLFYLASASIIWKLTRNWFSVLAFCFNPLIVMETLVGAHNDIVMLFCIVASFYLFKSKRIFLALLLFMASVFIKYATIFLLPIYIYILYKALKKEKIVWEHIYLGSGMLMVLIFFLSFIREEIYPWYAQWFLPFFYISDKKKQFAYVLGVFSYFLMLRYTPFMYSGSHFGITPFIKTGLIAAGIVAACGMYFFTKKRSIQ